MEDAVGQWLHVSPAVCSSPWYRLKAIPVSRRCVSVQVLCSPAREGGCGLLCLGLWKCLRKLQMCRYCINFLISDPDESFVVFFKLFHNVVFFFPLLCCYSFSSNERTKWKISAIYHLVFLVECIKLSTAHVFVSELLCGFTFSFPVCDTGVKYCEMVFVRVTASGLCVCDQLCPCAVIAK